LRARKLSIQSYRVLKAIESERSVRYIFATFTVRNPLIFDLSDTIRHMNKSFERMTHTKRFTLEIPPQKDDFELIHPHFHCLFVVKLLIIYTTNNLYIKQAEWVQMWQKAWQKALRVCYAPSVDVRIIKAKG